MAHTIYHQQSDRPSFNNLSFSLILSRVQFAFSIYKVAKLFDAQDARNKRISILSVTS